MRVERTKLILAAAALAASAPQQSLAQDQAVPIDEIVVTARKQAESLQRTPVAVSALTSAALERQSVSDLRDISAIVPGVVVAGNNQFGEFPISIRGIAASAAGLGADDPVAVYIDGVYIGRPGASVFEFGDVERLEVLRGPQGTLYGRNATAGAINVITQRPTDELQGRINTSYGSFNTVRASAALSGPLGEDFKGKVSSFYASSDGFETNLFDGKKVNSTESYGSRGALQFAPGENFDIELALDAAHQEDPAAYHSSVPGPFREDQVNVNEPVKSERDMRGVSVTANVDVGSLTLTSISAYRDFDLTYISDSDGTAAPIISNRFEPFKQDQVSQELRLSSAQGGDLTWQVGLYYFQEDSRLTANADLNRARGLRIRAKNTTDSYAAFAQADYKIAPRWTLTGGLRYSDEKKDFFVVNNDGRPGASFGPYNAEASFSAFTPMASLSFEASDGVFLYATASRGFKSGGFTFTSVAPAFDPEFLWSYEAGIKSDLFDRSLRLNIAAFHNDYSDLQVRQLPAPGVIFIQNAGKAKIDGVEVEVTWVPIRNVRIEGNYAYLDARYSEFFIDNPVVGAPDSDFSDKKLNRAPRTQGRITAAYEFDMGSVGRLEVQGTYRSQSRVYYTEANVNSMSGPGFEQVDARLTYWPWSDDRLSVALVGRNLTDSRHITNTVGVGGGAFILSTVAEPTNYLGEVRYRF